jgi:pimeloyl-ACP methyl ester carboxylesterase
MIQNRIEEGPTGDAMMWSLGGRMWVTRPSRMALAVAGLTIPALAFLGLFSFSGGIRHPSGTHASEPTLAAESWFVSISYPDPVLTALCTVSAAASPLPAQAVADPRTAPKPEERFRRGPTGLSLVRPYVRGKTPVVFVHGLWASPSCWRRMIDALAADPAIGGRFQFWMFGYATGNPIPYSGYLLRRDLDEARRRLDPGRTDPAFDRMVLIGHSMGGLICKMVVVDSGDRLWRITSDRPVGELKGDGEDLNLLRDCLIFRAHPGVRRVICIATPQRGSRIDSGSVRAIGTRLVVLPDALRAAHRRLLAANPPGSFREPFREGLPSSIDELEWASPILTGLAGLVHPPALQVHTIIAVRPGSPPEHRTDGVVSYESAHVAGATSEKLVSAGHYCLDLPEVIGEVRRILREHAATPEPRGRPVMHRETPPRSTVRGGFGAAPDAPPR